MVIVKEMRPSVLTLPPESHVYSGPKDSDTCEEFVVRAAVVFGIFIQLPPVRKRNGEIEYRGRIIDTTEADKALQSMSVYYYKK